MKHILVVDDKKNIRELIRKYLEKEGFRVTARDSGEGLLRELDSLLPDLLVLDIMLPGVDGLELCREIRRKSELPIVFVSARDEEFDRILGLELGGDDYLTKPFSPRELVARVKNIFKRLEKPSYNDEEVFQLRDIKLYPARRYVEKNGQEIHFTTREFDLLEFLLRNKNHSFTRDHLIERIWGYDYPGDGRNVDDLVKRIRKKLSECGSQAEITTVWGYGYRIDD